MKPNSKFLKTSLITATLIFCASWAQAQDWKPAGPVKMIIAFAAGGGADTQARLVAQTISEKTGWKIEPQQVLGKGGLNAAAALKKEPADGTAIAMVVTETLAYDAISSKAKGLQLEDFTPLATTAEFQLGLVAMAKGKFASWEAVKAASKAGTPSRFGTASQRQADMAYHLSRQTGIKFNIVSVKGGAAIMNGLVAGDLDIGWVAGAQTKAVASGDMVNIARGIATPLAMSPNAPSIKELGGKFYLDGYFMFIAPKGMPAQVREAWGKAIREALETKDTPANKLVVKGFGSPAVITGAKLDAYMRGAVSDVQALMADVAK